MSTCGVLAGGDVYICGDVSACGGDGDVSTGGDVVCIESDVLDQPCSLYR